MESAAGNIKHDRFFQQEPTQPKNNWICHRILWTLWHP